MQNRMQYIREEYQGRERLSLNFSCEEIELIIAPGTLYEGSFVVYGNSGPVHGYVYSTDRRMECLTGEFMGAEEGIIYRFHGTHLSVGEVVQGEFQVISNVGEYILPYIVRTELPVIESLQGEITNLNQFAALAKSDWEEALRLFYSQEFAGLLRGNDRKYTELYRGLSARSGNRQNMEEFLIACGKKQSVSYRLQQNRISLDNPVEITELTVVLYKESWGYTRLKVVTEGEFLCTQKEIITDDDFLGNQYALKLYADPSLLHRGKNLGRVKLVGPGVMLEVTIQVLAGEGHGQSQAAKLEREHLIVELIENYQRYRLRKMAGASWLEQTGKLVERLVSMNEQDVIARLFQAQLLIYQDRQHEGSWVLTHGLELMERQEEKDPGVFAYYLYLTTQINRDREYVRQVISQVEDLYRRNRTNWKVAWILLLLSPDYYRNDGSRFAFLEKQFQYGCTSPVWYLESILTLNSNPALLRRLGEYEIHVLHYGAKQEVLSEDLKEQFLYLAGRCREFLPVLLRLLVQCYRQKEDERVLQEICAQLIKGGRTDKEAYLWYAAGVERELRITRLYEYYMMSMDLSEEPQISRKALLYFSWQTNMDYERTAYLYYYLLKNRQEYEELFAQYRERMEHFVVDQILKEHMNRHLAYLYQELLTPAMFSAPLAYNLSKLLFACMIKVSTGNLSRILVYRPDMTQVSVYPINGKHTWVAVYSEKDVILFEDVEGNRFFCTIPYEKEKLMRPEPFLGMMSMYVTPGKGWEIEFDKYLWDRSRKSGEISPDIAERGRRIVQSAEISGYVKGRTWMRLLHDYQDKEDMRSLDVLLDDISWEVLDTPSRQEVIRCLIVRGKMDKARDWLARFGPVGVEPAALVQMYDWMERQLGDTKEELLLWVAKEACSQGKYHSGILEYLGSFWNGLLSELEGLRQTMLSAEADSHELCERMLWQILFTGAETEGFTPVLRQYLKKEEGNELTAAYLNHCAYDYLLGEKQQDDFIFREIVRLYKRGETVQNTQILAFLKYVSQNKASQDLTDKTVVRDFLKDALVEGIRLNCFRNLNGCEDLLTPWADKTIIEWKAGPDSKVTVHYTIKQEDGEVLNTGTKEMKSVPGGIFYQEFVLFWGEVLQYYFVVEQERQKEITQSFILQKEACEDCDTGKFHMINEVLVSHSTGDYERMDEELEDLYHKEYLSAGLFTLR